MKINLNKIDKENFIVREGQIAGETCSLVFPKHIGCKWDKNNLIFRSSIWNSKGEPVSLSFKKFFNWGEQPDLTYVPFSLTANGGCQIIEKIDGSTLIVSRYKGETIIRTRGTFDASLLDNGHEIELLKQKYPKCFQFLAKVGEQETADYSLIYEWTTPNNKIVINYGDEPELRLIGVADHIDYTLFSQDVNDSLAETLQVKRPQTYSFNSILEMLEEVPLFKDKEGVAVYCNKGQDIRKIKGEWYLHLHRMKNEMGSFKRVVDFYFSNNEPTYQQFYDIVCETLDFEIAEQIKDDIQKICEGTKEVNKVVEEIRNFVDKLKDLPRKEAASSIINKYKDFASVCFLFLDNKELENKQKKQLFYKVNNI